MKSRFCTSVVVLVTLMTVPTLFAQRKTDSWAGTWKLNLAKSKYDLGAAPKSAISKLDPSGGGWNMSQDVIDAQGRRRMLIPRRISTERTIRLQAWQT